MIFWILILLTCAVNLGCCATVELYARQNYSGLLKKVTINPIEETYCIQFDQTYEVRSLKTEKCVMVYETEDCKRIDTKRPEDSKLYSIRVERDTALFDIDGAYSNRKEERGVKSFHLCGTVEGGGLLNVDIYSGPSYTGNLVASFAGVCQCKNIPSYMSNGLKGKPFSIDNNGNNMYFYDKEDCTGQQRLIPAGDNERSRSVFRLDDARAVVVRSFRPADGLPCPNLNALINKFTFSLRTYKNVVKQITTYAMTNRQRTTVKEDISLNKSFTVEYSVAKAFTNIHTTRVKAGVLMNSNNRFTAALRSSLQSSLEAHYQYPSTDQNTAKRSTLTFEYNRQFVKPSCTTCTVNISVPKFEGYPLIYIAEAIVTGVVGDDKMSAEQIRYFLPPGMKYIKDFDDYSVVVTVGGEMKCSYVSSSSAEMSCLPLPDC